MEDQRHALSFAEAIARSSVRSNTLQALPDASPKEDEYVELVGKKDRYNKDPVKVPIDLLRVHAPLLHSQMLVASGTKQVDLNGFFTPTLSIFKTWLEKQKMEYETTGSFDWRCLQFTKVYHLAKQFKILPLRNACVDTLYNISIDKKKIPQDAISYIWKITGSKDKLFAFFVDLYSLRVESSFYDDDDKLFKLPQEFWFAVLKRMCDLRDMPAAKFAQEENAFDSKQKYYSVEKSKNGAESFPNAEGDAKRQGVVETKIIDLADDDIEDVGFVAPKPFEDSRSDSEDDRPLLLIRNASKQHVERIPTTEPAATKTSGETSIAKEQPVSYRQAVSRPHNHQAFGSPSIQDQMNQMRMEIRQVREEAGRAREEAASARAAYEDEAASKHELINVLEKYTTREGPLQRSQSNSAGYMVPRDARVFHDQRGYARPRNVRGQDGFMQGGSKEIDRSEELRKRQGFDPDSGFHPAKRQRLESAYREGSLEHERPYVRMNQGKLSNTSLNDGLGTPYATDDSHTEEDYSFPLIPAAGGIFYEGSSSQPAYSSHTLQPRNEYTSDTYPSSYDGYASRNERYGSRDSGADFRQQFSQPSPRDSANGSQ